MASEEKKTTTQKKQFPLKKKGGIELKRQRAYLGAGGEGRQRKKEQSKKRLHLKVEMCNQERHEKNIHKKGERISIRKEESSHSYESRRKRRGRKKSVG